MMGNLQRQRRRTVRRRVVRRTDRRRAAAGRPTLYSEAIAEAICDRLVCGESLLRICRDPKMPGRTTVHRWLLQHREFWDKYARARIISDHAICDDILWIVDSVPAEKWAIKRARLQAEFRWRSLSRMTMRKYGFREPWEK